MGENENGADFYEAGVMVFLAGFFIFFLTIYDFKLQDQLQATHKHVVVMPSSAARV